MRQQIARDSGPRKTIRVQPRRDWIVALTLTLTLTLALPLCAQPSTTHRGATFAYPYIESMPWTEIRDSIAAGDKTIIIPVGGVEQNGPHMVLGKHNYIVSFAAGLMAERLGGNTLVAPVVNYVPEGNYNSASFGNRPGNMSNPLASYEAVLEATVRSLRVHGFTDILLIGDSGGNQGGMTNVANRLNEEWKGSGVRVFALNDYYTKARADLRAWLTAEYGYTEQQIGSHAGITDTSQLMYLFPQGVRLEKRQPGGGGPQSGVSGDPTKATVEIGKKAIDFKVNAGVAQYKALKAAGS
jgi:creatinine amidohydrolase/Fe(II)-dependent formamide hydrolase-like protein